jgi:hypothetical protein
MVSIKEMVAIQKGNYFGSRVKIMGGADWKKWKQLGIDGTCLTGYNDDIKLKLAHPGFWNFSEISDFLKGSPSY